MLDYAELSARTTLLGVLLCKYLIYLGSCWPVLTHIWQEFVSAGLSFALYTAVLLRVRGNLVRTSGKWTLRFVPHGERWRLAIRRDMVDSSMMQVAARMVWYPVCHLARLFFALFNNGLDCQVAYTILLLPVTISRFYAFSGHEVSFRLTIFSDFVFNLQGVVNVALFLATRRFVPDTTTLPLFEPRKRISLSSPEAFGITPFVLPPHPRDSVASADPSEKPTAQRELDETHEADVDAGAAAKEALSGLRRPELARTLTSTSTNSMSSIDSQTPFLDIH